MQEEQIAAKLQQNIHRPDEQQSQPSTAPTTDENRGFVDDMGDNVNLYRLYDYFNVEPAFRNGENENKLQVIYRWAADKAQSTDYLAVANVLTAYGQGMGAGQLDMSNLNRMYQFIQLDRQMEHIRQEQEMLYR